MKLSAILNPETQQQQQSGVNQDHKVNRLVSPPLSPNNTCGYDSHMLPQIVIHGKPRSRFSEMEDAIICEGVAKGLTWGQISRQLPHRKRATCFNRYRTLQGIRKSRRRSSSSSNTLSCASSSTSSPSPPWVPSTPPDLTATATATTATPSSASSSINTTTTTTLTSPLSSTADLSRFILPSPSEILHSKDINLVSHSSRLPPLVAPTARYAYRPFTPY
ncbi:hypothetical protein RO3G_11362 [Lichtheimia corymbifera JMRC:FSU:9682]|uniref:Myb-like domain-containing protein n=1 Tax=Lichtheimia corymbifera JMRC:FSU:9682 TaxID=1263082 RepID=A0A068RQ47_9FUNG|nr:hypothetical protein RO3G_11362 [Lichtheimia corymbifera JMRC:FSU:9682]